LHVEETDSGDDFKLRFDPKQLSAKTPPKLKRPDFLAIIASVTLALALLKKANGKINGFVIEYPIAGGHNAPPRGALQLTETGEPVYGARDDVDLQKIRALDVPFWLAGGYGHHDRFKFALEAGAVGIQVGTAFALCNESGLTQEIKSRVLELIREGKAKVFTDPIASPTGFPFKVVQLDGTTSEAEVYEARTRICDLGYLRHIYKKQDGSLGYRCPAGPVTPYLAAGGAAEETKGRKCLCNGLISAIGLGQVRAKKTPEPQIVTTGDELLSLKRFIPTGKDSYTAVEVIEDLLGQQVSK